MANKSTKPREVENKIEIATQTLDRNIVLVTNCDTKTSIVLALVGVLLTIILTNDGVKKLSDIISTCVRELTAVNIIYLLFFFVSVVLMLYGIFKLCSVLIANTSESLEGYSKEHSKIFFGGIQKHNDVKDYIKRFKNMNEDRLLEELLAEIYDNARIATQKYKKYNIGLKFTMIGFVFSVVTFLVGIYLY